MIRSFDYFHLIISLHTSDRIFRRDENLRRKERIRSFVSQNREQDGGISGTIYLQGNRGRRLLFHATGVTRFHEREREREREGLKVIR